MHDIAFLHTSPVHVPTFNALMHALAPELRVAHGVRADLLADAQRLGVDDHALVTRVQAALAEAATTGAAVVVCTCSTIAGIAEAMPACAAFQVTRIDRAMADEAVRRGPRVLLVAALQSTLKPTAVLLQSSADRLGHALEINPLVVEGAWPHFEAGRHEAYIESIVSCVALAAAADAVVLAQASMAPAAERLAALGIQALTSPRLGVQHALSLHSKARAR